MDAYSSRLAFTTPSDAPKWRRRLVFSPLARIVNYVVTMAALSFLIGSLAYSLGWYAKTADPLLHALADLLSRAAPALLAYLILVRGVERRPVAELSLRTLPAQGGLGLLIGVGLMSIAVAVLWLLGSYHVLGTNPGADWVPAVLVVGIGAALGEEIISRGVLFRIVEEGLGTWWALGISAAFFGIAHIFNPNATLWSSLAIAIEAGVLLALIFHVTRTLWACIGLHAAWNISQGTIYGIPVSGTDAKGWLVSSRTGPDWLSGGAFGAEASVVALAVCSTVSLALLVIAWRRRSFVRPRWSRRATVSCAATPTT